MSGRVAALRRGLQLPSLPDVSISPRNRRRIALAAAVLIALSAFYLLWFRDCPLFRVHEATVTGAAGQDAAPIERALRAAAGDMTTLHVREDDLMRAVRHYPVVAGVRTNAHFPNKLDIQVIERRPAAVVVAPGRRVAVAGDGILLTGIDAHGHLPVIHSDREIGARRLSDGSALAAAAVLGGAPADLSPRLTAIRHTAGRGWAVKVRGGPDLFFGSATRLRAKWMALTRVLADKASAGASYIDVRLPERPVAGGLDAEPTGETSPDPLDQPPAADTPQAAQQTGAQAQPQQQSTSSQTQQSTPATPVAPSQSNPQP